MSAFSMTVEVKGTNALKAVLRQFGDQAARAMAGALYREGERIMARSKADFVPVDNAILKGSGFVTLPETTPAGITVILGYGGPAEAYALAVHEHPSEHSPPSWVKAEAEGRPVTFHPPGRGPKFLERPMLEAAKNLEARLAAALRKELEHVPR